jgi:hypothetical protein
MYILVGFLVIVGLLEYKKHYIRNFLFRQFMKAANDSHNNIPDLFSINDTGKSASIKYTRYGKSYILNIPYDRSRISSMSSYTVYLIKNNQRINITQQSGIPYLVTADELGGNSIEVETIDGDFFKIDKYEVLGFIENK